MSADHLIQHQFKKGEERTKNSPGRPKGSRFSAMDICDRMDFDPLEVEILIAKDQWKMLGLKGPVPLAQRLKATQHITDKIYPSLKAIELKEDLSEELEDDRIVVILPSNDRELPSEVKQISKEEAVQIVPQEDLMDLAKKCSVPVDQSE